MQRFYAKLQYVLHCIVAQCNLNVKIKISYIHVPTFRMREILFEILLCLGGVWSEEVYSKI